MLSCYRAYVWLCVRKCFWKFENRFSDQKWNNSLHVQIITYYVHERKIGSERNATACCRAASRVPLWFVKMEYILWQIKSKQENNSQKLYFSFIFRHFTLADWFRCICRQWNRRNSETISCVSAFFSLFSIVKRT